MGKKELSRQDLINAIPHIRGTMDQIYVGLYWSQISKKLDLDEGQRAIFANACLESSILSLRILDEFFSNERKGDMVTSVYFNFKLPKDLLSGAGLLSGAERIKINNHLAHITWKRINEPIAIWSHQLTHRAMILSREFLCHLTNSFLTNQDSEIVPTSQLLQAFTAFLEFTSDRKSKLIR